MNGYGFSLNTTATTATIAATTITVTNTIIITIQNIAFIRWKIYVASIEYNTPSAH